MSPDRKSARTAAREDGASDIEQHREAAKDIFVVLAEQRREMRIGADGVGYDLVLIAEHLVEIVAGAAHVIVAGDQPERAEPVLLEPARGFLGVGAGVDRFAAEVDAAVDQPLLPAEPANEV